MGNLDSADQSLDNRMAGRLKALRVERGWSLDELAKRCGISRATLSRLENADVSPTASALGKLCSAYNLPMSRLMAMVEGDFSPFVPRGEQVLWQDPETGFSRRSVSPPAQTLGAELLECELPAGRRIEYSKPPRPGLEHHLFLLEGALELTVDGQLFKLHEGDCLRYQLYGASLFETARDKSAKYILAIL
jgi:transcriptional regulator with XRE-family HTH domain